jgi:hypothetical protein
MYYGGQFDYAFRPREVEYGRLPLMSEISDNTDSEYGVRVTPPGQAIGGRPRTQAIAAEINAALNPTTGAKAATIALNTASPRYRPRPPAGPGETTRTAFFHLSI